jgi:hypothetical protein
MSPIAGLFVVTYGFAEVVTRFGKLSRLRSVSGDSFQLRSMNFKMRPPEGMRMSIFALSYRKVNATLPYRE